MDFQAMQNEVGAQLRFDVSVAANLTLVKRWINRAQQYTASRHEWSWLETREIVQTVVDKTQDSPTGSTVAVNSAGTTVTGTATDFATTDVGRYIQFATNNDWYRISARAGTTSLTIEKPFTGTANVSGINYTIRTFYYSLSSSVDQIVGVKQARSPRRLSSMSPITVDRWAPFYQATSTEPMAYSCWGMDTSNNWVIQFYPWPTAAINMDVSYRQVAVDLSANGDIGFMPQKLRDTLLVDGAIAYGREYLNDDRYAQSWRRFNEGIELAILKDGQNKGTTNTIERMDEGPYETTSIRYPSNYPVESDG